MISVLQRLTARTSARAADHWSIILRAADLMAVGKDVQNVDDLSAAMAATGQTTDDLESLVSVMTTRREKLAAVKGRAEFQAEAEKRRATFEQEKEKFAKLEQAYREKAGQLFDEALAAERRVSQADLAIEWLTTTRNLVGPMRQRMAEAVEREREAREQFSAVRRELRDCEEGIRTAQAFIRQFSGPDQERSGVSGRAIGRIDDTPADPTRAEEWSKRLVSRKRRLGELQAEEQRGAALVAEAEQAVEAIRQSILKGDLL